MIQPSELRIGNYVNIKGERPGERDNKRVSAINPQEEHSIQTWFTQEFAHIWNRPKSVEPISLTENWILKFGFTRNDNHNPNFKSFESPHPFGGIIRINSNGETSYEFGITGILTLKYVHQLQNLYFALTGKEL